MLIESNCYKRHCKHFLGVSQPDGTELTERYVCEAFLDRIPNEIAFGDDKHEKPVGGQGNDIVYEEGHFPWENSEDMTKALRIEWK